MAGSDDERNRRGDDWHDEGNELRPAKPRRHRPQHEPDRKDRKSGDNARRIVSLPGDWAAPAGSSSEREKKNHADDEVADILTMMERPKHGDEEPRSLLVPATSRSSRLRLRRSRG